MQSKAFNLEKELINMSIAHAKAISDLKVQIGMVQAQIEEEMS